MNTVNRFKVQSWLFQTGTDRLLPGVEPIAKTAQAVNLPADGRPRGIDLSPKPAPEPPKPPEEPAKPAATPEKPAAPPGPEPIDITYGLACVITNAKDPNERWVKWIEVNPLTPRDYLKPEVSYDFDERQIRIDVRALDADGDGQPDRCLLHPNWPLSRSSSNGTPRTSCRWGLDVTAETILDRPQGVGRSEPESNLTPRQAC